MSECLKNIKTDKIMAVFDAALSKRTVTRTELVDMTGLSYVTVNNIASALVDADILRQTKGTDKNGSRRSRILSVKFKRWIGIYNLDAVSFTFSILDLTLKNVISFEYVPSKEMSLDASVKEFLRDASLFAEKNVDTSFCCGIGVLVPGEYNVLSDTVTTNEISHFQSLRIANLFTPFSFGHTPVISSAFRAFANSRRDGEKGCTYSLFLNKHSVQSALIPTDGYGDIFISDLGSLELANNKSISDCITSPPSPEPFFSKLASIIYTVLHTAPVSRITVSGNMFARLDAVGTVLRRELLMICEKSWYIPPEIVTTEHIPEAVKYLGKNLRTAWFSAFIGP